MAALVVVLALVCGATASAQTADKTDARSLLQSGLKLFEAKDYLGALAVFRDAYERFPSAKILLNIATTLTRLDRSADAANTYQRYLDASDSDPTKHAEVTKRLAELDRKVGIVELTLTPATAEVELGDGEWLAGEAGRRLRVAPGAVTVRARADGHQPGEQSVRVAAGGKATVAIALEPIPAPAAAVIDDDGGAVVGGVAPARPRSRLGALAVAHVDVSHSGGAALVGLVADLTGRIQVQAAAVLGATAGGYAGARLAVLDGRIRPIVAAGIPIFVSNGARVAARGAGGVELELNRHLVVIAELGVEHVFNAEPGVVGTVFVPALGVIGRL